MDTTISLLEPRLEQLPFVTRFRRLQAQMDGEPPLKRFVVFALEGKMLIASRGYRFRWMAERRARSLRFYGVTVGTVVLDQEDFAGVIYRDEAMVFEDFLELMELN